MEKFELRIVGTGGNGIILTGLILASASMNHDELYVAQTQAYYGGPQCLDTNGAFLRFEKDCFRLPETNPLFQNTPYQESILPEKYVA